MATAVCETCIELVEKCRVITYDNINFRVTDNKFELVSDSGIVVASILGGQLCTVLANAGCSLGGAGGGGSPLQIANSIAGDQDAQDVLATALSGEIASALLGNAAWRDSLAIAIEPKICDLMSQDGTCMDKLMAALKPRIALYFQNNTGGFRDDIAWFLADALTQNNGINVKWQNVLSTGQGVRGPVTVVANSGIIGDGHAQALDINPNTLVTRIQQPLDQYLYDESRMRAVPQTDPNGLFTNVLGLLQTANGWEVKGSNPSSSCVMKDSFGNIMTQTDFSLPGARLFMNSVVEVNC